MSKLLKTGTDAGTIGLCCAFTAAACQQGPVAGGVAVAAVALPVIYSMFGIMARHVLSSPATGEIGNSTGLKMTGGALKNIFSDFKMAAIAVPVLSVIGLGAAGLVYSTEKSTRRWEEIHSRPVLSGDTPVRADELCARNKYSYEIPYTHDGKKYKIVCP